MFMIKSIIMQKCGKRNNYSYIRFVFFSFQIVFAWEWCAEYADCRKALEDRLEDDSH